jgi:hypothetical protein
MVDTPGPLRITPPSPQAYDTSPGEQMVLRGLDAGNLGALYGVLLNQRARGDSAQQRYSDQLGAVNQQQGLIAGAKLAADSREADQRAVLGLVQHGGMGLGSARNALNLRGLPSFLSDQAAANADNRTDQARVAGDEALAFLRTNQGQREGVEAGIGLIPGQTPAPGPVGRMGLGAVTGTPLDLSVEGLRGATSTGNSTRARTTVAYNPLSETETISTTAADPAEAVRASRRAQEASRTPAQSTPPAGGAPQGPARLGTPAAAAGGSPPVTGARGGSVRSGPPTPAELAAAGRIDRRQGTPRDIERTSRGTFVIMDNGRRVPLPTE